MKAKLLTLVLFGIMTLSFVSCNEDDVTPAKQTTVKNGGTCECSGGITDREPPANP